MEALGFLSLSSVCRFFYRIWFENANFTKFKIHLRNIIKFYILQGRIRPVFTFTSGVKALELAFNFLCHLNDTEAVVYEIQFSTVPLILEFLSIEVHSETKIDHSELAIRNLRILRKYNSKLLFKTMGEFSLREFLTRRNSLNR